MVQGFSSLSLFAAEFYWENPVTISSGDARFPTVSSNEKGLSAVIWQEVVSGGKIYLSGKIFYENTAKEVSRFAGPFSYTGEVPNIFSVAVNNQGKIAVAVLSNKNAISVFSTENFETFNETVLQQDSASLVAPRIFRTSNDDFMLFATQGQNESFSLMTSVSQDGKLWSEFEAFLPSFGMQNAFIPTLIPLDNRDLVVFQASFIYENRLSYQLYATEKSVSSSYWSDATLITDSVSGSNPFTSYHNQRPSLLQFEDKLYMAWERTYYNSENANIYFAELNQQGKIIDGGTMISSGNGNCSLPILFSYGEKINALWFDTRRGVSSVYHAERNGFFWQDRALTSDKTEASFGNVMISSDSDLSFFWQEKTGSKNKIIHLAPDKSVGLAKYSPKSFTAGKRSTSEKVRVQVNMPEDSSGIAGFSYSWSQDISVEPENILLNLHNKNNLELFAKSEGKWYLKVRVTDYAGNWSESSTLEYYKDTTPPGMPNIIFPEIDENGFLKSNTFAFSWEPPEDEDVAGYSYNMQYMGTTWQNLGKNIIPPQKKILTGKKSVAYSNKEDGIWAFSVAAIDSVGNVGEHSTIYVSMNKYIPHTVISYINTKVDDFGNIDLSIFGNDFTKEGTIDAIYFSKDGKSYDEILIYEEGDFKITSNKVITGIQLGDLEEGKYKIGLLHSKRGLYWSGNLLNVGNYGTVKIGNHNYKYIPTWKIITSILFTADVPQILFWIFICLTFLGLVFSVRGIASTTKETFLVRNEVIALIHGDIMPLEKKHKAKKMKQKGVSLKIKLALFTSFLVILIILLVSVPLGYVMLQNQEQTLVQGLQERVNVLLESLSSGVKAYMPNQNVLELSFLPSQTSSISEANYATILGFSSEGNNTNLDYVWASNDPEIINKVDSESLSYGTSIISQDEVIEICKNALLLNDKAKASVSEIASDITELTSEGIKLATKTDKASIARREEIQSIINQLSEKLSGNLNQLSQEGLGSYPKYDSTKISDEHSTYLFYKPVLYRQGADQNFVRSVILIEVSTETLRDSLASSQESILYITGVIALIAVSIGVIGSTIVASFIIRPIRKLASHVAMIRDTDDKETLEGKDIKLKSKDEIGLLGETVNDMTRGLVKAAAASKDLTVGKEVQKMFIPLEVDSAGRKLTTGKIEDDYTQFFGYYEGAKGVSGDYFDYLKLDDKHYAIIKCDVSGKGVPAALIMVEVATLFLHYFKDWSYKKNGYNLTPVVSQINDLIESRGFKGRFAAFTLCIYNSQNGEMHFCNAGDNLIHIYEAATGTKKTITLPESAAAGVFPTFMVDMKGGFKVQTVTLKPGDVLFLYTDGIEEAKRLFRDKNYNLMVCAEPGLEPESPHNYHQVGQDGEEMSPERVNAIIEAVFHKSTFVLEKDHNPIENEELVFDFSTCEGSAEEAIMALVSVEKIFRMYKNPKATEFDKVQVDAKVDDFLNKHFLQYNDYCANRKPHPEFKEYLYYTEIFEDDQYDDLTLIAIKRKK